MRAPFPDYWVNEHEVLGGWAVTLVLKGEPTSIEEAMGISKEFCGNCVLGGKECGMIQFGTREIRIGDDGFGDKGERLTLAKCGVGEKIEARV